MSFTPQDFVAMQLRESYPQGDWNAAGVDRSQELAAMMLRAGIRDLAKLQLRVVTVYSTETAMTGSLESTGGAMNAGAPVVATQDDALQFVYENRAFGFLGTPDRNDTADPNAPPILQGLELAWSAAGHGNVGYFIVPAQGGFVIAPQWGSSSDMGTVRSVVKFFASVIVSCVLPAAGISAGSAIGSAIVGESFAAAYPALTSAIGNVALSTAMNGGNIESAVRNVATSYAGASIGGAAGAQVLDATGIDALGKVSSAAVSAFVQGKDVQTAVATTLAMQGAKTMDDYLMSDSQSIATDVMPYHDPVYDPPPADAPADPAIGSSSWLVPLSFGDPAAVAAVSQPTDALFPTQNFVPSSPLASNSGDAGSSTFDASSMIRSATSAMLAALQLVTAYNRAKAPAVNTTARAVAPNGAVVVANDNGYIQTRNPDGTVRSSRPPVGQPQSTLSGSLIVNNGDGTYTLIDSSGNATVKAYPAVAPSSNAGGSFASYLTPTNLAIGGAALVGLLLLSRRRA